MVVVIADEVTRTWPTTEGKLTAASETDYATEKTKAIERAKRELYGGTAALPAEADIQDVAKYWIADRAVLFLIPMARDYYALKRRLSDAKEGATTQFYDLLRALDALEDQLNRDVAQNKSDALDAIGATSEADDVPAVSTAGMMIDPMQTAMWRGPL